MTRDRRPMLLAGAGVIPLLVLAVLGGAGMRVMPSYLAAWLFVLSVPLGALLLVGLLEAFAGEASPLLPPLRALLPLMPVAALLGLPVLLLSGTLYDPSAWPAAGIGREWFAHTPFSLRMVVFLLIWSALALQFSVPPRLGGRRVAAGLGFGLTLVTGTLAAYDWVMAVEPGIASSEFGLLVLAGAMLSALSVAALLACLVDPPASYGFAGPLLILLALWMFLHFSQFLVIWSANEPHEASWYLHRIDGLGAACLWLAVLLLLAAPVLRLPAIRPAARRRLIAAIAGLALLVRLLESFWLITPSFRGHFTLSAADLLAAAGLIALVVGVHLAGWLPALGRRRLVRA
ncbi:hypothetical protein [Lichenicola sp.]|uniref:hypothetical protein n=1 Tax=Lichenicola sp. TaxID=2804529 RepID=UPI003B001D0D